MLKNTIQFETVTYPPVVDPDGNVIAPESSFEAYVIRIWDTDNPMENNAPFLFQPTDHNTGKPFATKAEAEAWYDWYIANVWN